ncbi:MAG: family 78 glycoside hydrolase catalytic domain [Proteiniphilum sp.]
MGKKHFLLGKSMVVLLCLHMFFNISCQSSVKNPVQEMWVEYLNNPLGIDTEKPRFSWKIVSQERGVKQAEYQIIVCDHQKDIKRRKGTVWDSGIITDDESVNINYKGIPLESNKTYYWTVGVSLNNGKMIWGEQHTFHTGILDNALWEASWITSPDEITDSSPLFRKSFAVKKKIKNAVAYVTAVGFYELYLNGNKVGDHVLDPGITDYRKTVLYSTYDVTSLLKKGKNVVGAMVGNGAWNLRKTTGRWSWHGDAISFGNPALWVQLMITYTDGSQETIVSDNTWKTTSGPITFNNLYGGEDYDARKEIPNWNRIGMNDSGWRFAVISKGPKGLLKSQMMPAIKVTETLKPIKQIHPEPGVYLFDLGQNMAGWWKIEVKGNPGQTVRVRGAETLNDSIFSQPLKEGDKLSISQKYHSEVWTDYIIKSNEPEIYEPHFFYTGFRYVEVTTTNKQDLDYVKVAGRVVRTDLTRSGTFSSSDSLLNRIHQAGLWSQMGNTLGYPTDCPHREKGAYNGDGQIIAETSMHDFQMASFYSKWLHDMRDSQEENGRIPNTSPTLVGGMGGGVAWGSAYILIPWWMYNYYQDKRILEEHYPTIKKYLTYLKELGNQDEDPTEPYIIDNFMSYWYSLGEWCAPGKINERRDCPNHAVVNTFYYYYDNLIFSKIAEVLGHTQDSKRAKTLSDTIRQEFNKKFFDPVTGLYGTEETYQTYQLLALAGDMVPEEQKESVLQTIIDDVIKRDDHLNTGIIGTKYLWPVLVENGQNELAYRIASQTTYPSFGYWIKNGATTLLEQWEGDNSHNHQMFGTITEYFYKFLAGIQSPMEGRTSTGYKKIYIEPHVPQGLNAASASIETVNGHVVSAWKRENNAFFQTVSIPANTSAMIVLPTGRKEVDLYEGNKKIWNKNESIGLTDGIKNVACKGNKLIIEITSGVYNFKIE